MPENDRYAMLYKALMNSASMGIIIVDDYNKIDSANPYAANLLGYTVNELVNRTMDVLFPIPRGEQCLYCWYKQKLGRTFDKDFQLGNVFVNKKNGDQISVSIRLHQYDFDNKKNVIVYLDRGAKNNLGEGGGDDLNAQLEAAVKERTRELTEGMLLLQMSKDEVAMALEKEKELGELKSRFVSLASHEFRTPLSTVLSSAYLLKQYTNSEDQPKRDLHLQRIFSSVKILNDILNDFLNEEKIAEGKIQVRSSMLNVATTIASILDGMTGIAEKQQRLVYIHTGDENICTDESLLRHIVMNLVSNANKFSPQKSRIEINTIVNENHLIIKVKDYGMGVSKTDQAHLMERFYRGGNADGIQGTGLGLHLVSKYAQLLNGTVHFESHLNQGSAFTVKIKLRTFEDDTID